MKNIIKNIIAIAMLVVGLAIMAHVVYDYYIWNELQENPFNREVIVQEIIDNEDIDYDEWNEVDICGHKQIYGKTYKTYGIGNFEIDFEDNTNDGKENYWRAAPNNGFNGRCNVANDYYMEI